MFIDGERKIFFQYYIVFARDLILSFPSRPRRKCPMVRKKPYLSPLLKNRHSRMTLELNRGWKSSLCLMQILLQNGIQ